MEDEYACEKVVSVQVTYQPGTLSVWPWERVVGPFGKIELTHGAIPAGRGRDIFMKFLDEHCGQL